MDLSRRPPVRVKCARKGCGKCLYCLKLFASVNQRTERVCQRTCFMGGVSNAEPNSLMITTKWWGASVHTVAVTLKLHSCPLGSCVQSFYFQLALEFAVG